MIDNRTTDLLDGLRHVGNLHEFAELFGFDWHDDSDWTWHDVAVKMADDLEQAVAVTLWSGVERSKTEYATLERIAELEELDSGVECEVVQGKNGPKCSNCGKELPEDPYSDYEGNFCPTCGARVRGDAE